MTAFPWAEITALIQAVVSLAWPALALVVLVLFVKDIKALISRVTNAEVLGVKVKLRKELDQLAATTESLPIGRGPRPLRGGRSGRAALSANVLTTLHSSRGVGLVDESPRETLLQMAALIDAHLRWALERTGLLPEAIASKSWQEVMQLLREGNALPEPILDSVASFRAVRNEIVHAPGADEDDVIRAIDIAGRILSALEGLTGAQEPSEAGPQL
jgi:hypothetical protein